jgi:hypothetical protein
MRCRAFVLAAVAVAPACGDNLKPAAPDGAEAIDAAIDAPVDAPPPGPSLTFFDYVQAIDLTPDGRTAVFGDISTPVNKLWFLDTVTMTLDHKTDAGDPLRDFATAIAQTGQVTALHGDPVQAGLWTPGTGWADLGTLYPTPCDQDVAGAWDISADGQIVVGAAWNTCAVGGFRWSAATGTMTELQVLGERLGGEDGVPDNRPTVISDDGAVAAGFAMTSIVDRAPARWFADGTGELLPRASDDSPGEVLSISADGSVLAGIENNNGVVWTATDKLTIPRFEELLPFDPVFPNAMTADGSIIFGGQGDAFSGTPQAFVWSQADGVRKLADIATAAGLTIPTDVVLGNVLAVSSDGTVLIGTASNVSTFSSSVWMMRLPADAL